MGVAAYWLIGEFGRFRNWHMGWISSRIFTHLIVLCSAYLIGYLILVRWVVAVVRINNHPRVEVGIAAFVTTSVMAALVPYSIGLHFNDYREYPYSTWQVTNWIWTLGVAAQGLLSDTEVTVIASVIATMLLACVLAAGRNVLPRRIATPEKVRQELAAQGGIH